MNGTTEKKRRGFLWYVGRIVVAAVVVYLLLLMPESGGHLEGVQELPAKKQPFAWNQDAYWKALEAKYRELRQNGCAGAEDKVRSDLEGMGEILQRINLQDLGPDAPEFSELEIRTFRIAPLVSACTTNLDRYINFVSSMRAAVKRQSEHWDMKDDASRTTLYRLLYGSRGAIEEVMVQAPAGSFSKLVGGSDEPSATPSTIVRTVHIHSGDILVSRGGAPTSALIARGNDYPGNFSHIALVYVDPATKEAKVVESHIEIGVVVSTVEQYLADKKLRVMLLRPRVDLPQIVKDPMLPHKAAEYAYKRATSGHVPYDFAMDYKDHSKLFCSEVASEAYERFGLNLWTGVSHISSPGLRRWLAAFGVRHFETQEPSDLEYDPQMRVVAEWVDPETLKKDRLDNAVTDVMLEGAERGDEIMYKRYLLPLARLLKGYSLLLNRFGKAGPIPEGMSAPTALRTQDYMDKHEAIGKRLAIKAAQYKKDHGYEAPYWVLVSLAREAEKEIKIAYFSDPGGKSL
jgi:hypothetical protein